MPDVPPVIIITYPCICRSDVFVAPIEYHFNKPTMATATRPFKTDQKPGSHGIPFQTASAAKWIGMVSMVGLKLGPEMV
jgi:hypothetical protein